jgi:drug/metabolite transporter (DMT)-like permease
MLKQVTNNKLGIILILLSFAAFPVSNSATRYILHSSEIPLSMYFSYVKFFAVAILLVFGLIAFGKIFFSIQNKKIVFVRCIILMINNICLTIALSYLALDIFYSIVFIMPLMTTIMGVLILKERFTLWNMMAIIIGFLGILVVIQPNITNSLKIIGVVCTIVAAITGSLSGIIARKYLAGENPYSATFYVAICSFILGIIMIISEGNINFAVQEYLSLKVSIIIFLSALFTIVASSLYMKAYQISNVTIIAPAQYTQLIWGILLGYLIFNDKTTETTLLGCGIIIFATLFNYYISKRGRNEVITK